MISRRDAWLIGNWASTGNNTTGAITAIEDNRVAAATQRSYDAKSHGGDVDPNLVVPGTSAVPKKGCHSTMIHPTED